MSNESTKKIRRNFLALSPEKRAETLMLLLELAESNPDKREHLIAVHNTLKNLNENETEVKANEK